MSCRWHPVRVMGRSEYGTSPIRQQRERTLRWELIMALWSGLMWHPLQAHTGWVRGLTCSRNGEVTRADRHDVIQLLPGSIPIHPHCKSPHFPPHYHGPRCPLQVLVSCGNDKLIKVHIACASRAHNQACAHDMRSTMMHDAWVPHNASPGASLRYLL